MDGFLLIDKPSGPTSHDVVDAVRKIVNCQLSIVNYLKVGHAGTLDPFATGLLILGIGKATKELGKLVGLDKEYEAMLRLGAVSDTYDRTGRLTETGTGTGTGTGTEYSKGQIEMILKKFTGAIEQIPPMYSAKKVGGKKLYELARKGIEIERKPSKITIYQLSIVNFQFPTLTLRVKCSSGTYIRSLANDIGQALGCGAYLEELRRTAIFPFIVSEAAPLSALTSENIFSHIRSVQMVLDKLE